MSDLKPSESLAERVQRVVDSKINPALAAHGGFMAVVGIEGSVVSIRLGGGCQGCGMASYTLRYGIEQVLRDEIPEITEVRDVSDPSEAMEIPLDPPEEEPEGECHE